MPKNPFERGGNDDRRMAFGQYPGIKRMGTPDMAANDIDEGGFDSFNPPKQETGLEKAGRIFGTIMKFI